MPLPRPTRRPTRRLATAALLAVTAALTAAVAVPGCTEAAPRTKPAYAPLPLRVVPEYMADSIFQYTDMTGREPFPVSGYGLVANLRGTGGSRAPTAVRDYMIKELARHQMGGSAGGFESPDKILDSRDFTIVRVDGYLPPGARAGADWSDWFDVRVTALAESDATSLAHGDLYECDLKIGGANPLDPGNGTVSIKGQATGAVFVNPTYVLDTVTDTPAARASRRTGVVLAGARVMEDRPLVLRLRAPERRLARAIERRVIERFQDVVDDDLQARGNTAAKKVANAQDEALVYVYVPKCYADHWDHFAGIVNHLYVRGGDPAFAALKARQLADAAVLPKAPLLDISYAWEGLGKPALFALEPLMADPMPVGHPVKRPDGTTSVQTRMESHPDVRYAAARAAAFIGDRGAVQVLLDVASTPGNPFRVNAVQTLGELPYSPRVDGLCRGLLDSDEATVRIEAYKLLARHGDPSIYTRWVKDGDKQIFALDIVRCTNRPGGGKPLVYATQQGVPRVAIFGTDTALDLPVIVQTLDDNRLMIASTPDGERVSVSYRSPYQKDLLGFTCGPNIPELVARLGGDGTGSFEPGTRLHLGYADVVAVLQALIDRQKVSGAAGDTRLAASFVLGEPSTTVVIPTDARVLLRADNGGGRPTSDHPTTAPADRPTGTPADAPPDDGLLRHPAGVSDAGGVPLAPVAAGR